MKKYNMKNIPIEERPRERLKKAGPNNLSDRELLSIVIGTGTKNKNVEEVSIDILNKYKLKELKEVTIKELKEIEGIGEVKAIKLVAIVELSKRIYVERLEIKDKLDTPELIFKKTKYLFNNLNQEYFYALYFNSKQELINYKLLFIGTINAAKVHPREIFKEAYRLSAYSIVVMHNHPSNDTTPSSEDKELTNKLIEIGKIQGIPVLDHIIVGNNNFYSFYQKQKITIDK